MNNKARISIFIGAILEYYDIALYGFLAFKLAPLFFPHNDATISILASFGAFAAGFIMRPIGGAIFGHIGDKWGRKRALNLAMALSAAPTLMIGLLPTYNQIGIIAPILLTLCRLLQGACISGVSAGALIMLLESSSPLKRNFTGSLLCSVSFSGVILGALIGALFTYENMPSWGWRVPFILGAGTAYCAFYIQSHVKESIAFSHPSSKSTSLPFVTVIQKHTKNFICTVGLGAVCSIPYHILFVYSNALVPKQFGLTASQAILATSAILVALTLILPVVGAIVDRIGNKAIMRISMVGVCFLAYPFFYALDHGSFKAFLLLHFCLTLIYSGFLASISAFLIDLFPMKNRYSGIAIGYTLGNALFGGSSPFIATTLVYWFGGFCAPAIYLMISGLIGIWALAQSHQFSRFADYPS